MSPIVISSADVVVVVGVVVVVDVVVVDVDVVVVVAVDVVVVEAVEVDVVSTEFVYNRTMHSFTATKAFYDSNKDLIHDSSYYVLYSNMHNTYFVVRELKERLLPEL